MTTSSRVTTRGQSLTPGNLVALYVLDISPLGVNQQFCFTASVDKERGVLRWRGQQFVPTDVRCSGFEVSSQGALPEPQIEITNVTRAMSSAAILYRDLVGAKLTRTRTYAEFLDNGTNPDPLTGAYPPDVYSIEQKVSHTKRKIVWKLSAAMDQEGRKLPGRTIIRDVCPWRYRRWDASKGRFDYTGVKCPYTGSRSYDKDGKQVSSSKDEPGRHIDDCCKPRFGKSAQLPYGGFPGIQRVRA